MIDQLFTGKYRPKNLNEIILSDRIKQEIGDGELKQNYLFYGSFGVGKCVIGDTIIEVLDERTNKVYEISINDFIKLCQCQNNQ